MFKAPSEAAKPGEPFSEKELCVASSAPKVQNITALSVLVMVRSSEGYLSELMCHEIQLGKKLALQTCCKLQSSVRPTLQRCRKMGSVRPAL